MKNSRRWHICWVGFGLGAGIDSSELKRPADTCWPKTEPNYGETRRIYMYYYISSFFFPGQAYLVVLEQQRLVAEREENVIFRERPVVTPVHLVAKNESLDDVHLVVMFNIKGYILPNDYGIKQTKTNLVALAVGAG